MNGESSEHREIPGRGLSKYATDSKIPTNNAIYLVVRLVTYAFSSIQTVERDALRETSAGYFLYISPGYL